MESARQLRESEKSTPNDSTFHIAAKSSVPGILGRRRRWMALIASVIGLATFLSPLIRTDSAVAGRIEWSPFQVVTELYRGTIPADTYPVDPHSKIVDLGLDAIFGCSMVYLLLLVIVAAVVLFPRARFISGAAAWGCAAMYAEFRYEYSDLQAAIYGFAPLDPGNHVHAAVLASTLLIVLEHF